MYIYTNTYVYVYAYIRVYIYVYIHSQQHGTHPHLRWTNVAPRLYASVGAGLEGWPQSSDAGHNKTVYATQDGLGSLSRVSGA